MTHEGRLPWRALAGLAMGRLGWTPETFWAATPLDLALALAPAVGPARRTAPMDRGELEALRTRFPDRPLDEPDAQSDKPGP